MFIEILLNIKIFIKVLLKYIGILDHVQYLPFHYLLDHVQYLLL